MTSSRVTLGYREYEVLPADGRHYELHDGELSVTPAPGTRHQRILLRLYDVLRPSVSGPDIGELLVAPVDCILDAHTIVQPDLIFLDPSRAHLVTERGIEGAPTLVVEVVSPSTTLIDRSTKLQIYARHGVPYYWIVDPEARRVECYRLAGTGYELDGTAAGAEPASLAPFPLLPLVAAALWP